MSTPNDTQLAQRDAQLAAKQPTIADIMSAVVQGGITSDSVAVMERLCALKAQEDARGAEREFASAFATLQADTPNIQALKIVPGNDGEARYKYAPYEDIMRAVQPFLKSNGFAVTFDSSVSEDGSRVTVKCTLMHRGGHSRSNSFTGRIGAGPPKSSDSQKDGAGYTYAKRFALCAALNITIEQDADGADHNAIGECLDEIAADELFDRCEEVHANKAKFLRFGGIKWPETNPPTIPARADFMKLPLARLTEFHEALNTQEAKHKAKEGK